MDSKAHIVIYTAIQARIGGVENNLIQLLQHLSSRYRFTVLCQADDAFRERLSSAGADWQPIDIPTAFSPKAIIALARQLKHELHADLIHTLDPRGCTVACPAARLVRIPTIHQNNVSPLNYHQFGLRYVAFLLGEAFLGWTCIDAGMFVAENVRQRYLRLKLAPRGRSHYHPYGVDIDSLWQLGNHREAVRTRLGIGKDEFLWVNLARMTQEKAHDIMISAAAQLSKAAQWRLLLLGDGLLRGKIESQIDHFKLQERVQILGALPHEQALEILAAADALVFPSRYENMPITVLEAMAMGIPAVVTDVGDSWRMSGVGDLAPASLLVPVDDSTALAETMQRLMNDPRLHAQLKAGGLPRALPFSVERSTQNIADIYERLLKR
jgi:glycosyltransferase involved in cell wall biosynthesis